MIPRIGIPSNHMANSEFQINPENELSGAFNSAEVVALRDGGFVSVYRNHITLYGQRYDSEGAKLGAEFPVTTMGGTSQQSIASLEDGGFIVVWTSRHEIFGQRFDEAGAKTGSGFQINSNLEGVHGMPSVLGLEDGGFLVAWNAQPADGDGLEEYSLLAQRYDSLGNTAGRFREDYKEFTINETYTVYAATKPSLAGLEGGGFAVTWTGENLYNAYVKRFDVAGESVGDEFQVNSSDYQLDKPQVNNLANDKILITWMFFDGAQISILGRLFDASGEELGPEFVLKAQLGTSSMGAPKVSALDDGGFVLVWSSGWSTHSRKDDGDEDGAGIFGQLFDGSGNKIGSEILINSNELGNQVIPSVTSLADGGFIVVWENYGSYAGESGIYGQRFDALGNKVAVNLDSTPPDAPQVDVTLSDDILSYNEIERFSGISGKSEAGSTISLIADPLDTSPDNILTTTVADSLGNWAFDPASLGLEAKNLLDGSYDFFLTSTDAVGNVSEVTTKTLIVDIFNSSNTFEIEIPALRYVANSGVPSFRENTFITLRLAGDPILTYSYDASVDYPDSYISGDIALTQLLFEDETIPVFSEDFAGGSLVPQNIERMQAENFYYDVMYLNVDKVMESIPDVSNGVEGFMIFLGSDDPVFEKGCCQKKST
jgi:hypothetical protein